MNWYLSHQADPRAVKLADRHYSRKHIGTPQFMPPGRQLVLLNHDATALWGISWPILRCVDRPWCPTAWMCVIFRNESPDLASELIREAIACTRWRFPVTPPDGMVTMIDARKVASRNPGYCYKRAGFRHIGYTRKGLHILQLLPGDMPAPAMPNGATYPLLMEVSA